MKQIRNRPDLWLALGIFVPLCILLELVFMFTFMNELSFYFSVWGALFLSQAITIITMQFITLFNKRLRRYVKDWTIALIATVATIFTASMIYAINPPVLYPSHDAPQVTIASLCDTENKQVSPGCFLSLVPPAMSGIVATFGLNVDPYNIPKTQIISFIFCELLVTFFLLVVYKTKQLIDLQNSHDKHS